MVVSNQEEPCDTAGSTGASPLVSVIIPAYNAEDLIGETLETVVLQSYENLEILVVDDGSTDGTVAVVEDWCVRDRRIRLIRQGNQGVCGARNAGIEAASGDYLAFLDADDLWHPEKIRRQVRCFEEGGEHLGMVYSLSLIIDMEGRLVREGRLRTTVEGDVFLALLEGNFMGNGSSVMVRADCAREVGGYTDAISPEEQNLTDWEFYLAVAERHAVGLVPEFDVGYRQVEGSFSKNPERMMTAYHRIVDPLRERHPGVPESVFRRGKNSILLWQLSHQKIFSKNFFSLLALMFRNDLLVLFRPHVARVIYPYAFGKLAGFFRSSLNRKRSEPEQPYFLAT